MSSERTRKASNTTLRQSRRRPIERPLGPPRLAARARAGRARRRPLISAPFRDAPDEALADEVQQQRHDEQQQAHEEEAREGNTAARLVGADGE